MPLCTCTHCKALTNDNTTFSNELFEGLRLLYVKSNFNFSEAAFNNIYKAFNRNKISFNKVKRKLGSIVGIEPKIYDMCVNSCCAFVGVLENETKCKFCKEDRYYSNGKARKNLPFISIIERLKLQFKNPERSKELLYRHNYTCNKGEFAHNNIGDIFDGQIYQELLNDEYFPDPRDIAFTASCDGYQIFRQKTDDLDIMHLFFENVAPHMFRHWIGKFYPKNNEWNSNEYTISSKTWVEIGEIMERSRSHMPPDIGRPPRNIVKHSAGFKAVEWANWIILFSLPLLKGRLPQSNLLGWSRFVEAVKLCIQPLIEFEELDLIRNLLIEFYNHYANSYGVGGERLPAFLISFHYLLHVIDSIEDFGPCRGFWQFPMERFCGMLIPLVSSRKLPYVNLFNNVLMQERFKYLQLLPIYNEKVFSNFKEKEKKTWPVHRVYSNELYVHEYEFYSPFVNCVLTKNEVIKLKQCYAAIFQKNTSEITDIKENYAKYGKLRTKDGNIISSKWWKKENDSSRNDFCVAINLTVDLQERNYRAPLNLREEEIFGQIEYFMVHEFQNQERMFAYIRKIKKLEKNSSVNLKFFDSFGPLQYVEINMKIGNKNLYLENSYY
ncbi:hypothetical protein RhiirA1_477878 [Rhizophagus irregularis]|uniref:Transposase domain-containing protein n=4 Tax=Rhizophagus irregularis TaxID=588596 RepID=A0A2N0QSX5_9GLOM|nr:hypothetical protein RhiirA1_477878 [Rhizophagus irregularis]